MKSFSLLFVGMALAEETCQDGTCAQDESTMLQLKGLRHNAQRESLDTHGVNNEGTQCWHGNQCGGQGGECPSGYCGDDGVCCRLNWSALNPQEAEECGSNGFGINNHHTCQPRLLNEGTQCWHGDQCQAQGGRCESGYCGARGVCCREGWAAQNDKETAECGANGHGIQGMHTCQLPPPPPPPPFHSWPQMGVDRSKCNLNIDLQIVSNQAECQALAVQNGHTFYSYRHNEHSGGAHKCFSSAHCDDALVGDRTNEWNIYSALHCYGDSEDACREAALALGLTIGGVGYDFTGDFQTNGCYAYTSGTYQGHAYYGLGGETNALSNPAEQYRPIGTFDCPQYQILGYGMPNCAAGKTIDTYDECEAAHLALGLEVDPVWEGTYGAIPGLCSTREVDWGGGHHFHFNHQAVGVIRVDLSPVCKV